jgi:cytochrome b6-f complex iron-sulfur subunit
MLRLSFILASLVSCHGRQPRASLDSDAKNELASFLLAYAPSLQTHVPRISSRVARKPSTDIPKTIEGAVDVDQWLKANPGGMVLVQSCDGNKPEGIKYTPEDFTAARRRDVVMNSFGPEMVDPDGFVPDMQRRNIMNWIVVATVAPVVASLGIGYILFLYPPAGGGGDYSTAGDKLGNPQNFNDWIATHDAGDRALCQGIGGDATWLIINEEKKLETFAVSAICTHLGCVVPWVRNSNKYICPCHGSQYDFTGKVIRGPAPLSLALAHVEDVGDGKISLRKWKEKDFRTGEDPWWK